MGQRLAARARRVTVSEPAPDGVARPDYADAFEIRAAEPDARPAERLARDALERAPRALRALVLLAHRHVLRFRLGPYPSPGHVLGWRVVSAQPDVVRLEAVGPLLHGVLVGRRVDPTRTALTTFLVFRRPLAARAVWSVVGHVHRWVAPYLLERAVASGVPEPVVAG